MNPWQRSAFLLLAVILSVGICTAQSAPVAAATETPATKEDVARMLESLHVKETTQQMMMMIPKQMQEMMQDSLQKRLGTLKEEDVDRIQREMARFTEEITKDFP